MISDRMKQTILSSSDEKSRNEIHILKQEIQQVYQELKSEIQHFDEFRSENVDGGVMELLSQKANKDSVAQALHWKANRNEIDALLAQKLDIKDFERMNLQINWFVERSEFESLKTDLFEIKVRHSPQFSSDGHVKDLESLIKQLDSDFRD